MTPPRVELEPCPFDGPFTVESHLTIERDRVLDAEGFVIAECGSKERADWLCAAMNAALSRPQVPLPERVGEIRERAEKATKGPWRDRPSVHGTRYRYVMIDKAEEYSTMEMQPDDARFVAHAREDIPYLLAHIDALSASAGEWNADGHWRCFHCGEAFTDAQCAANHFGGDQGALTACQIKGDEGGLVALIRKQEAELDRYRAEDAEHYRAFYSLGADHSTKLREAEEAGYAKGLADGRALRKEP